MRQATICYHGLQGHKPNVSICNICDHYESRLTFHDMRSIKFKKKLSALLTPPKIIFHYVSTTVDVPYRRIVTLGTVSYFNGTVARQLNVNTMLRRWPV